MQKNGSIVLTNQELSSIRNGHLPTRIFEAWGLTLEDIRGKIATGEVTVMEDSPYRPEQEDGLGY